MKSRNEFECCFKMSVLVVWNTNSTPSEKMSSSTDCDEDDEHHSKVYMSMIRRSIILKQPETLKEIIADIKKHKCRSKVFQEEKGVEQETIIQLAAKHNQLELFYDALEDIFVDTKNSSGKTALHIAAEFGNEESIEVLLKRKARLSAIDNEGDTPFHSAARCRKLRPLLRQTLVIEVDVKKPQEIIISECDSTFVITVKQALNKKYIEDFDKTKSRREEAKQLINQRNNKGDSPLDLAAKVGDLESVEELLGADVDLIASVLIKIILQSLEYSDNQERLNALKEVYHAIAKRVSKSDDSKNNNNVEIATDPDNRTTVNFPANHKMRDLLESKIQLSFEEEKHADGNGCHLLSK